MAPVYFAYLGMLAWSKGTFIALAEILAAIIIFPIGLNLVVHGKESWLQHRKACLSSIN